MYLEDLVNILDKFYKPWIEIDKPGVYKDFSIIPKDKSFRIFSGIILNKEVFSFDLGRVDRFLPGRYDYGLINIFGGILVNKENKLVVFGKYSVFSSDFLLLLRNLINKEINKNAVDIFLENHRTLNSFKNPGKVLLKDSLDLVQVPTWMKDEINVDFYYFLLVNLLYLYIY